MTTINVVLQRRKAKEFIVTVSTLIPTRNLISIGLEGPGSSRVRVLKGLMLMKSCHGHKLPRA